MDENTDNAIGYWTVSGSNLSAWSLGSTLLALGLSPAEAIGVIVRSRHWKCMIKQLTAIRYGEGFLLAALRLSPDGLEQSTTLALLCPVDSPGGCGDRTVRILDSLLLIHAR